MVSPASGEGSTLSIFRGLVRSVKVVGNAGAVQKVFGP